MHDLHSFMDHIQRDVQDEYERIRRWAVDDPGTAGDQGEETWAAILRRWLPPAYSVVTKGRILSAAGEASRQVDVVVLSPDYPPILKNYKYYLAPGVLAAFECKLTLRRSHIIAAVQTGASLKRMLKPEFNSYAPPVYGILAHSHNWKRSRLAVTELIDSIRSEAEHEQLTEPVEELDILCVANLGTWTLMRVPFLAEKGSQQVNLNTSLMGPSFHPVTDRIQSTERPVGRFLTYLMRRLAGRHPGEFTAIAEYFHKVGLTDFGVGGVRVWEDSSLPETAPRLIGP